MSSKDKQSELESQQDPYQPLPYDPAVQMDIAQQQQLRGKTVLGTTYSDSRVVTTFDARPINGTDFIKSGGTVTNSLDPPP